MHDGLDLRRFRKVASDKAVSTLQHAKGHEIKIAHGALSPKMREAIASMPLHLADGTPDKPLEAMDPESPATASDDPDDQPMPTAPEPAAAPPPAESLPAPAAPGSEQTPPPAPAASAGKGEPPVIDVVGKRPPPAPISGQILQDEASAFAAAYQRGDVHPKTMQDLYGERDTVGKVGMLFGLLLGGAGSGLTGQPNAVLTMMQKQIDNDFEAQKASATNKQNWYTLSREYIKQRYEIPLTQAQTEQAKAGAKASLAGAEANTAQAEATRAKLPSEIKGKESEIRLNNAQTALAGASATKINMAIDLFHQLQQQVDAMPPGPAKVNAANVLQSQVKPGVDGYVKQQAAEADKKLGVLGALAPGDKSAAPGAAKAPDTGVNDALLRRQMQLGAMAGTVGAEGAAGIPQGMQAKALQEADLVKGNRSQYDAWKQGFEELDRAFAAGKLNEQRRNAIVKMAAARIARGVGAPTAAEAENILSSMYPSWKDYGLARADKIKYGLHHFQSLEANTSVLDSIPGLKTPFPPPPKLSKSMMGTPGATPKKPGGDGTAVAAPVDDARKMSRSGRPMVFRNGQWIYEKAPAK